MLESSTMSTSHLKFLSRVLADFFVIVTEENGRNKLIGLGRVCLDLIVKFFTGHLDVFAIVPQ